MSAAAIGPWMWALRASSLGNASTIQKVVASVRSANQTTVPASAFASSRAPVSRSATSPEVSSFATSLATKARVRGGVVVAMPPT